MMNIKTKLLLTVFISSLVALAALSGIAVNRMHLLSESALAIEKNALLKDYDLLIKGQVQSAVSLLATIEARAVTGEITRMEAQKLGADLVRQLRFQKEGYFWIDTVDGTNVVLLGSTSEGKNRINLQDNHGKYFIREIIRQGRMEGGGYTDYWFPKAGGREPLPKRGYSLEFKPWGWVVGTGNYIDDINTIMAEHRSFAQKEYTANIRFFTISSFILILVFLGIGFMVFRLLKTDKKIIEQADENLQKSEARFQQLFEESPDAYSLLDDSVFIDCNRATEVMLRGDRLQIIGRKPDSFSPEYQPDGRLSAEAAAEKMAEAFRTGTNHFEWLHRRLDGSNFWAEISLSVMTLREQTVLFSSWRDITVRKQLESEMRQLVEEQKIILENAGVGIAFVKERRIVWSNATMGSMFGYSAEEITGVDTVLFYPSQDAYEQFGKEAYPVLAQGETLEKDQSMCRRDGSLFTARVSGTPVDKSNPDAGSIWIFSDVTIQKELESQLHLALDVSQAAEAKVKLLLQTTDQGIYGIDNNGCFTYVNRAGLDILGYEVEELLGRDSHSTIHHSHADGSPYPATECPIYRANAARKSCRADNELLWREDGTSFDAEFSSYPVIEYGLFSGSVVTFSDITERKQTDNRLRKLLRAVEQSPVTTVITDLEGTIEYVNPVFTELTGYTPEEAIGQNPRVLKSGQTPPETFVELWTTITAGKIWEGEFHNRTKDGRLFWEHAVISPLLDLNGTVTHYLAVKDDITEKKGIMEQLVAAKEHANAANRAKSEFLANMSHEIRSPMNGVIGMTQLLELTDLTEEQKDYVETLSMSGRCLISLINDILDLSKIESGKITLEQEEFNLPESIKEVVKIQYQAALNKGLKLHTKLPGDIPDVLIGDQLRVKQIVLNLIGNAVKFTAEGSVTTTATILEQHADSMLVQIAVRDTGIGISPDALDDIFKPFVQEDSSITRKFGGTGLGLSISRSLAEQMGGSITIESTLGVGSCFMVRLPFIIGESTKISEEASLRSKITLDGPSLRILLVEDDATNTKFALSLLEKMGHSAIPAENGRECLAALEQGEFDLVLMDIQMPIMNGEQTIQEIRAREAETSRHLPVIALTAFSLRGDKERFMEMGFDGYLSKPLGAVELMGEMKRVVGTVGETVVDAHGVSHG